MRERQPPRRVLARRRRTVAAQRSETERTHSLQFRLPRTVQALLEKKIPQVGRLTDAEINAAYLELGQRLSRLELRDIRDRLQLRLAELRAAEARNKK